VRRAGVYGSGERAFVRCQKKAWTEIAKKPLRRPSPALAVAAACRTRRRTYSSQSDKHLLLLPVHRGWRPPVLPTRRDSDDIIGNAAYYCKNDGGGSGGVYSVSSTDAVADAALDDVPEVDGCP
jgi:hypothetical protein